MILLELQLASCFDNKHSTRKYTPCRQILPCFLLIRYEAYELGVSCDAQLINDYQVICF